MNRDVILNTVAAACNRGDVYVTKDELYTACTKGNYINYGTFQTDLLRLIAEGKLHMEGQRVYDSAVWKHEDRAARALGERLLPQALPAVELPGTVTVGDITLDPEQRDAVMMAMSSRISVITAGAGCGKTTLVQAICHASGLKDAEILLCAPTGKAARRLSAKTGLPATTVHAALGARTEEDFLSVGSWSATRLVIIDEASMLTLAMLSAILGRVSMDCRIVLIGDTRQLPAIGAGNAIEDLTALGFPSVNLKNNHRQTRSHSALCRIVTDFDSLWTHKDLETDESFAIHEASCEEAEEQAERRAIAMYRQGASVQVIAPYNDAVTRMNTHIRERVNPTVPNMPTLQCGQETFRHGDRVMVTRNDRASGCSNGDIGYLYADDDLTGYRIEFDDGRVQHWTAQERRPSLTLAYAVTVHKAQGSEYDTILMPVTTDMRGMLDRNLFYTAISRAKERVVLFGQAEAIDIALKTTRPPRRSTLVPRARLYASRVVQNE